MKNKGIIYDVICLCSFIFSLYLFAKNGVYTVTAFFFIFSMGIGIFSFLDFIEKDANWVCKTDFVVTVIRKRKIFLLRFLTVIGVLGIVSCTRTIKIIYNYIVFPIAVTFLLWFLIETIIKVVEK